MSHLQLPNGTPSRDNQQWFVVIYEEIEGPYTTDQLRTDTRIHLQTFVWREGMDKWAHLEDVPELKRLFKKQSPKKEIKLSQDDQEQPSSDGTLVIPFRQDPWFFLLILILTIGVVYIFMKMT